MSDWLHSLGAVAPASTLVLALLAGAALGAMFFGGLWWTARRGLASPHPSLWIFGSLLLRMGLTLPGFFVVAGGRWERLLACLVGFAAARAFVTWKTRPPRVEPAQGAPHAP